MIIRRIKLAISPASATLIPTTPMGTSTVCIQTWGRWGGGMERESTRCPFHLHVFVKSIRKTQFYLDQRKEAISATSCELAGQ